MFVNCTDDGRTTKTCSLIKLDERQSAGLAMASTVPSLDFAFEPSPHDTLIVIVLLNQLSGTVATTEQVL